MSSYSSLVLTPNNKHKIAICQLTCTENKSENFKKSSHLISQAKQDGAKVK